MNTQEFVENYVAEFKVKFKKFFFSQLVIDIIEVIIMVSLLVKYIDNQTAIYICVIAFIVILELTFFMNIKHNFSGFKNFIRQANIRGRYDNLLKEYEKTADKEAFDKALSELETEIKGND